MRFKFGKKQIPYYERIEGLPPASNNHLLKT